MNNQLPLHYQIKTRIRISSKMDKIHKNLEDHDQQDMMMTNITQLLLLLQQLQYIIYLLPQYQLLQQLSKQQ